MRYGKRMAVLAVCLMLFGGIFIGAGRVSAASNPLPVTFKAVNSWKEGSTTCTQFTVRLANTGSKIVSWWMLKPVMDRKMTLRDSWSGKYSVSGSSMVIKPVSWNKTIPAKQTREIGFIIKTSGKPVFQKVRITSVIGGQNAVWLQTKNQVLTASASPDKTAAGSSSGEKAKKASSKSGSGTANVSAGSAAKKTPLMQHGRLQVKGGKLVDSSGKSVVLKGVSLHGINFFPQYVNKKTFQTLRDGWGVKCIRLAMYTQEYNGYLSGGNRSNLKKLVRQGVQYATELGLYVIIDWHILSDGNPQTNQKEAAAFFKEMAGKYKNHKNVFYEICNEPNGGVTWKQVKAYAGAVIKEIRKQDKHNVILVGTPTWSQDVDIAAKDPIKGYRNLMYTFHFYAGTHGEAYRQKVQKALGKGLPVFVSEFGISDASGNGSLNKAEGDRWIRFLKKNGISYVCWNLSNKNESSALLKSSCKKVSSFRDSDLSAQGLWYRKK